MSWAHGSTSIHGAGVWLHSAYGGQGVRGDLVPSTGANGPSMLYAGISLPAEAADEFRQSILSVPAGLEAVIFYEDGSIEVPETVAAGTYVGSRRVYKNGAALSPDPSSYTVIIGTGLGGNATLDDGTASGTFTGGSPSSLTGGATLDDGTASGTFTGGSPSALAGSATLDGPTVSGSLAPQVTQGLSGTVTLDGSSPSGGVSSQASPGPIHRPPKLLSISRWRGYLGIKTRKE